MSVQRPDNSELNDFETFMDSDEARKYMASELYDKFEDIYSSLDLFITSLKTEHTSEVSELKEKHEEELNERDTLVSNTNDDIEDLKSNNRELERQIEKLEAAHNDNR